MTGGLQHTPQYSAAAETKLDQAAGYVLLGGSILSFVLVGAGLIDLTFHPGSPSVPQKSIASVLHSALSLQPAGIINLGVLVLLATPLLRVMTAIAGFTVLKWSRFVIVSGIVLALLLISILFVA